MGRRGEEEERRKGDGIFRERESSNLKVGECVDG